MLEKTLCWSEDVQKVTKCRKILNEEESTEMVAETNCLHLTGIFLLALLTAITELYYTDAVTFIEDIVNNVYCL